MDDGDDSDYYKSTVTERKCRCTNTAAKLVDNKRRHLQKPLSAAKRDQVLMNATKEDLQLKKDFMLQMKKSQETFNEISSKLSTSIESLGKGISEGLGLLAMALNPAMANERYPAVPYNSPQMHRGDIGQTVSQHPYPWNGNNQHENIQQAKIPMAGLNGPSSSGERFSQMLFADKSYSNSQ